MLVKPTKCSTSRITGKHRIHKRRGIKSSVSAVLKTWLTFQDRVGHGALLIACCIGAQYESIWEQAKFALFPGVTNPHGPCACLKLVYGGNSPLKVTNQTGFILYTDDLQIPSTETNCPSSSTGRPNIML